MAKKKIILKKDDIHGNKLRKLYERQDPDHHQTFEQWAKKTPIQKEAFLAGYMHKEAEYRDGDLTYELGLPERGDPYDPFIEDALTGRERKQFNAWDHTLGKDLENTLKFTGTGTALGAALGAARKDPSETLGEASLTGAIRGGSAGLGAGLGYGAVNAIQDLVGSPAGKKGDVANILAILAGGAGGYALSKSLTKTPSEEADRKAAVINKQTASTSRQDLIDTLTEQRTNG